MAAFLRSVLKKPHVKPLLWNCTTYGLLYGGAEFTQQSKAKYYDVSLYVFSIFLLFLLLLDLCRNSPLVSQLILQKDIKQYDMPKVGRFWVLGTFAFPPILYAW